MATGSEMLASASDYTPDDLMCVCISRQVVDGEMLALGIATPLVGAGYLLAERTHAPNVTFASAIGNAFCQDGGTMGLTSAEELWLGQALSLFWFADVACQILPTLSLREFFRPAQIDPFGNTNNVVIGDYRQPQLRLPGCGGIADVTVAHARAYYYVPRHSRAVFVERLDFVSGLGGPTPARPGDRPGPRLLISNLGVFDFLGGPDQNRMRLLTAHPGVTVERIRQKTGFPIDVAPDLQETLPPTAHELHLLREEIDPLGIRELERMAGRARRQRMREIVQLEKARSPSVQRTRRFAQDGAT